MMEFSELYGILCYGENKPYDAKKCKCHGTGFVPVFCCLSIECGCLTMPIDFEMCDCGLKFSDDEIRSWK